MRLCGSLNHVYGLFLPVFLWPIILIYLVHSLYLVYLKILPCVCMHLFAKVSGYNAGYLDRMSLDIASPLACKEPFLHICGWGGLLTSGMRDMWSRQGQPSSLIALLLSSWSFPPQRMNLQLLYLEETLPQVSCLTSTNCKRNLVCSGVLEAAYTVSLEQFMCISSPQQLCPFSLKSAILEIRTPWKLANKCILLFSQRDAYLLSTEFRSLCMWNII